MNFWLYANLAVTMFAAIRGVNTDVRYLSTLRHGLSVAGLDEVKSSLGDNSHFKRSCSRAENEVLKTLTIWFPLFIAAFVSIVYAGFEGYASDGVLSDWTIACLVVTLTPIYARPWTHPIETNWLEAWLAGMKAVLVTDQYITVLERIETLEQLEAAGTAEQIQLVELEQLRVIGAQLEQIIEKLPGSQQSEGEE